MRRLAPFVAALLVTAVLAMALPTSLSDDHEGGGGGNGAECLNDQTWENEDYRIWFHGDKFQVKIWELDGNNQTKLYQYKSFSLAEVTDDNDTVARMNLERASGIKTDCGGIEANETNVDITFSVNDVVYDGSGHPIGNADVAFEFHLEQNTSAAKFDLLVNNWPWQDNETELSYAFDVETDLTVEPAENGIGFRDDDNETRAFIEWGANATARYDDGHEEEAIVDGEVDESPGGGSDARATLRFTNATAGYNELDYDPWLAVGPYIIILGYLIGLSNLPPEIVDVLRLVPAVPLL